MPTYLRIRIYIYKYIYNTGYNTGYNILYTNIFYKYLCRKRINIWKILLILHLGVQIKR